jgi:hypothetical protein
MSQTKDQAKDDFLPDDLLVSVAKYLNTADAISAIQVCRHWKRLIAPITDSVSFDEEIAQGISAALEFATRQLPSVRSFSLSLALHDDIKFVDGHILKRFFDRFKNQLVTVKLAFYSDDCDFEAEISDMLLDGEALEPLREGSALEVFFGRGLVFGSLSHLSSLVGCWHNLRELDIGFITFTSFDQDEPFPDEEMTTFARALSRLENLQNLSFPRTYFCDTHMETIFTNTLRNLKYIDLSGCWGDDTEIAGGQGYLSETTLDFIASKCPNLQCLTFLQGGRGFSIELWVFSHHQGALIYNI